MYQNINPKKIVNIDIYSVDNDINACIRIIIK